MPRHWWQRTAQPSPDTVPTGQPAPEAVPPDQPRPDTVRPDLLAAPFGGDGDQQRHRRAVIGHATSFWTWRSLCLDQGLTDTEAVGAMTSMVLAVPQAEPAQ